MSTRPSPRGRRQELPRGFQDPEEVKGRNFTLLALAAAVAASSLGSWLMSYEPDVPTFQQQLDISEESKAPEVLASEYENDRAQA